MEQELFSAALGLVLPWRVGRSEFDAEAGRLDLLLEFPRGARFACPDPGCPQRECPVHDTQDKTWRHLDFFQYQAHLHAKLPRVRCPDHGVRQVEVSWARPGSGFTLLFEALLITFAAAMPVAKVAAFTGEQDTRIWRVLDHYVKREWAKLDFSTVEKVGVDETAAARGQDYVSILWNQRSSMARDRHCETHLCPEEGAALAVPRWSPAKPVTHGCVAGQGKHRGRLCP